MRLNSKFVASVELGKGYLLTCTQPINKLQNMYVHWSGSFFADNFPSGFLPHLCFGKQRALSVGQFVSFITLYVLNFIYIVEKCLVNISHFDSYLHFLLFSSWHMHGNQLQEKHITQPMRKLMKKHWVLFKWLQHTFKNSMYFKAPILTQQIPQ